jgi:glycosyltransferase involved in cell wall biosynthesis
VFRTPDAKVDPRRLRILVIASTYPRSEEDYAVPWLRESLNRLAARGHELTVLAPSYRGLRSHEIDRIMVHRFRYSPQRWESLTHEEGAPNRIVNPLFQLLGVPYVAMGSLASGRLAFPRRFDVINSHWPFPHGIMAATARLFGSAPVVSYCHGAELALARRKSWVRPILRWALRSSETVVCNSEHTSQQIRALSGRDAKIIPFGSTVNGRPTPLPRNEVPKILFTGRLIERKGVEYLIKAMPLILSQRPAILQITGNGDQRKNLEHLANSLGLQDSVQFLGFVTNQQLDELYAECDIYVNPSIVDSRGDTEGLGVTALEAFAHGRPVVASAVGGITDVVKHQKTGLLVPEKDEGALARAILEVLADPSRASGFVAAGLEHARQWFDWDRITDRLEETYVQATVDYRTRHLIRTTARVGGQVQ